MSEKNVKKKPSGNENRKRRAQKEQEFEHNKKFMSLDKYLARKNQDVCHTGLSVASVSTPVPADPSEVIPVLEDNDVPSVKDQGMKQQVLQDLNDETCKYNSQEIELSDCGTWPVIRNSNIVNHLIQIGAIQTVLNKYPEDEKRRHFSSSYYSRKLSNGEAFCRRWLVYSVSKDSVFCFCCRLFENKSNSKLVSEGFNKWKNLSETVGIHENSTSHMKCYKQWVETEMRIKTGQTIDKYEQRMIAEESKRWQNVLLRITNITLYLATNNMAFRGDSDKLYTPHNGKFLGLLQLLAKFDPVMQNHLTLATKGDISDHYCGKRIQNELIDLMAEKVDNVIITRALKAIYYAIIADCTPDISRKEQLSLTIRFVDLSDDRVEIKEHFLGFVSVNDSTGSGLTEVLLDMLTKRGLELSNCRGQGYDNGSNMKGKNYGVQKRILNKNPLALYVPCGSHNLNLVLCDSSKSSVKSVTFFGILQRLFTLFSGSVNRWKTLTDHVQMFSLKKLSDTRWEAKISSVKAVRYQVGDIHDALLTLSETEGCDPDIVHEAITLSEQLKDFSFLISLVVWYDVLFQINVVSKTLQAKDMDIAECAKLLNNCCSFLDKYRLNGFQEAIIVAKDLADELQIEPVFKPLKRIRRVKRQFDEAAQDEPIVSPEKKLEVEFFNPLLDTAVMSMKERFEQLDEYAKTWGFLYNVDNLPERTELLQLCAELQIKLTVHSKSDIDGTLLCDELISIKSFISGMINVKITPHIILNFIKQHTLQDLYPNVWITMRILLTIPVTVASGERSFSKLKLIKTYLRSTMSQDRLSSLGTLSIENEIAENLDFSGLIKDFAAKKVRKVNFGY